MEMVDGAPKFSDEFQADKAAGATVPNMQRLPILMVGDKAVPQSKSIERYIARRFGMYGKAWRMLLANFICFANDNLRSRSAEFSHQKVPPPFPE